MQKMTELSGKKYLVLDLKKNINVDPLFRINLEDFDGYIALTPLAYYFLSKHSRKITPISSFMEQSVLNTLSVENEKIAISFLERTFLSKADFYFGLMYPLKIALDYFSQEQLKYEAFSNMQVTVVTDVSSKRSDFLAHIKNNSSMYIQALECESYVQFNRKALKKHRMKFKALINKTIKLKYNFLNCVKAIKNYGDPSKDAHIISDLNYHWGSLSSELNTNFKVIAAKDIHKLIKQKAKDELAVISFEEIDQKLDLLFQGLCDEIKIIAREIVRPIIVHYHRQLLIYSNHLPEILEGLNVKFSLFNFSSEEDFILNFLLKTYGYETISYQHGSYMFQDSMIKYCDLVPTTRSICFGSEDLEYFNSLGTNSVSQSFGSYDVKPIYAADLKRQSEVVIFTSAAIGNNWSNTTNLRNTSSDCIQNWRRYVDLIDFFASQRDYRLTIKLHPNTEYFMYYPVVEYLKDKGISNVAIDQRATSDENYFKNFGVLVFDYPETSFLKALAAGHPKIVCYYEKRAENQALWELVASACDVVSNETSLSRAVYDVSTANRSNVKLKGRLNVLEKFSGLSFEKEKLLETLKHDRH